MRLRRLRQLFGRFDTAINLVEMLEVGNADELRPWLGRLRHWGLVGTRGQTKATEYFVDPEVLRKLAFEGPTTLKGIETHRLRALILQDLEIYRRSRIREIHQRIGPEIPLPRLRQVLGELATEGEIGKEGVKRGTTYLWTK